MDHLRKRIKLYDKVREKTMEALKILKYEGHGKKGEINHFTELLEYIYISSA